VLAEPPSDPERLRSCTGAIAARLSGATSPAILVDLDADRYGVAGEVMALAEKAQLPVAVATTAVAVIGQTFPYYAGVYNGQASQPYAREAVEESDCLLSIGYRPIPRRSRSSSEPLPIWTKPSARRTTA
jgi:indolepyruvate decarboxylase